MLSPTNVKSNDIFLFRKIADGVCQTKDSNTNTCLDFNIWYSIVA